jgi:hypothetical protein
MAYVRFTHGPNPISDYGHAMFVEMEKLDRVSSGTYGDYGWQYDGQDGVEIDDIQNDVWKQWKKDIETERMPYVLSSNVEALTKEEFFDELDPDNIVSSAGLWDVQEFVSWFWDRFEEPAVLLWDGAIVYDPELIEPFEDER